MKYTLHKKIFSLIVVICCLSLFFSAMPVLAISQFPDLKGYSIHVIKYKLKQGTTFNDSLPNDGSKVDNLKDANGNDLETLPGISYAVQRLQLKPGATDINSLSSFEVATGAEAFEKIQTTNAQGEASFTDLPAGYYQVIEKPNSQIQHVMEPVLVALPLNTQNGQIDDVYIYPKSNIISDTIIPESTIDKIPQTSGNIGNPQQIFLMIGIVVIMGIIGISYFFKKPKKHV